MSKRWDQLEERLDDYESQIDTVYQLYHIPVLAALMVFMLWVRVRHYSRHIGPDGQPLYRGNDPFYHYRSTNYVIENYPFTMPFDPWTGFDAGQQVGQFGTLFDQVVATAALIVGFGSPDQSTIVMTTLMAVPVIGTLCAIPVYFIGKRLGGRFGGLIGVVILALTPGSFLSRSVAGFFDHHIAEALGAFVALWIGMVMVTVAQREQPIYEFIETREFDLLKRPLKWGVAFGIAIVLTILVWPPAMFLFGIFAVFLFVHLSAEFVRGYSPDHVAIPATVSMLVAAVLLLPFMGASGFETTSISVAQPFLALAVAFGTVFMAAVARFWDRLDDVPRIAYPAGILGVGLVAIGVVAIAAPDVIDYFTRQVLRIAGLGSTDTAATVGEAQAVSNPGQFFYGSYGLAFVTALGGFVLLAYQGLAAERPRAEQLLVLVFAVMMLLFTLTQNRFDYYFVAAVGAGNAVLVGWIYNFVDLDDVRRDIANVKPYQILIVVAILFVVAGPLVATGATVSAADQSSQPGSMQQWDSSLDWMNENTPAPGAYGSGAEDTRLEYYGTYEPTQDFEYQDGEYGVLAWWDYGHYITTRGERIPVANPFQQHATESADFLLADNETESLEILEEDSSEGEGVRYVMVDYQLGFAGTLKYNAPTAFESEHNVSDGDVGVTVIDPQTGRPLYGAETQRGFESMRVRLYQHHGSAMEPSRFVMRFDQYNSTAGVATPDEEQLYEPYNSSEEARQAAQQDPNAIHGGVFGQPSERIKALEHFRLVHASEYDRPAPLVRATVPRERWEDVPQHSWVKTFERVEGAKIEGTGPANTEVQASVVMEIDSTGETFVYNQFAQTDDEGNWEMTVPYSTTGYDEYGTDAGYTNVSVRANSSYEFLAVESEEDSPLGTPWSAPAEVTEGQVLGENDTTVQVDLQEGRTPQTGQQNSGNSTSE
ncbi:oligosaccharyl transferase, archaeosortase A system-associated [Natronomonas halophila]|uniref:oligosaccharyl transferase, archaeosortase A system-associated n=1 Tax=Natronomonas halophila TaxID=2747817 RepID=UPI0015B3E64A|nr:oligosaccharyl transferase, archaeosortase A system-associated [Natronomonas halophila]QLD84469.1 oligosaccharyl transferase, archaeosortase A system-associated [Natronomonas halophila]